MSLRVALALVLALGASAPAAAQLPLIVPIPLKRKPPPSSEPVKPPPPDLPPEQAAIWPFPAPPPDTWWTDKRLKPAEAADPLGGRRIRRGERLPRPDNGVDPSTYRLWGLMPLQWQLVRGDELILEVWTRPASSVRQTVTRVVVRGGSAFVQARAGLACCEAGIGRRIGFDAELPEGAAERLRALARRPAWRSPRDVRVQEAGSVDALCVEGTAYDLTLVTAGGSVTLHRACDPAEVGEVGDILEGVLSAALGHDPRFDVIFGGRASFERETAAHRDLLASGGRLRANPDARPAPAPGAEPAPAAETDPGPDEPSPGAPATLAAGR